MCLAEDREAFILADELGFVEGYAGEHVTDRAENITSCAMFLATLVDRVKRMRLGTGTVNLPNAHPAAVASQIAMLDHLLEGRFNFGISPGGLLSDAEAFGNLDANRNEMFVEAINQVLAIWAGEAPYNLDGKYWKISTARTTVREIGQGSIAKPLQRPHPPDHRHRGRPLLEGRSRSRRARLGPDLGQLPDAGVGQEPLAEVCRGLSQKAGRPADPANWRVAKSIFVAEDDKTARDYATAANSPYRQYYGSLSSKLIKNGRAELFKTSREMADSDVTLDSICDKLVIWGSPRKVADEILKFHEQVGEFGTLLYAGKDWLDRDLGRRSMILLAEQVMPLVNAALAKGRNAAE